MTNGIWVLTHEQVSSFSVEAGPPDAGSAESVEDAFFFGWSFRCGYGQWGILGGGFNDFLFLPHLGKIPNLTNIFQMGWNHQPV